MKNYLIFVIATAAITGLLIFVKRNGPPPETVEALQIAVPKDSTEVWNMETNLNDTMNGDNLETDTLASNVEALTKSEENAAPLFQVRKKGYYIPPLKGNLTLSGTFGELRHNHFHAGLDIRTGGVEGALVHAAASGYVSRVKISERGYGKAIYIQHPNGSTTVYGHLQRFDGQIQDAVIARHYQLKSFEMDWYPSPGTIQVKQGQVIAYSGNSGGSAGPHLHFEIRDGKASDTYNPLLYGIEVKDVIPPSIRGIQIYQIDEVEREKTGTFPWRTITKVQKEIKLAPGTYGVGANWLEYFTDRAHRLGINYASMEVNGQVVFRHNLENFAFDEGRLINQHINYYHFAKTGVRYVKMFKDKGNYLEFYQGNGLINLSKGESKEVAIIITDMAGQKDRHTFKLVCEDEPDKPFQFAPAYGGKQYKYNVQNVLTAGNSRVTIKPYTIYNNFYLTLTETDGSDKLASKMIRVHDITVPLHQRIEVAIKPKPEFARYLNKLVLMEYNSWSRTSEPRGAVVKGNMVSYDVKNFGIFYLALDTIPPKVSMKTNGREITAIAEDLTSDITLYRGTIDGEWILLEYDLKKAELKARIPEHIRAGKHKLKLVVGDEVGNLTVTETEIII